MALSSLEVDLSGVEEGQTMTVKWRGKPVFIRHRTDAEINQSAEVALSELRDPQKDVDRAINPKVGRGGVGWREAAAAALRGCCHRQSCASSAS